MGTDRAPTSTDAVFELVKRARDRTEKRKRGRGGFTLKPFMARCQRIKEDV